MNQHKPVTVSVIATVLNEERSIAELLESLAVQTRRPDEIVITDGGSTDRTRDILQGYAGRLPLHVLVLPGANISRGRNAAIRAAGGEIIASTDAGVRLDPNWLAELVRPFEETTAEERPGVVAGFFLPDPRSTFERAMGATVLPRLSEIDGGRFLPSSRSVAFLRSAWERWPYPEWLDFCEDLIFDLGLKALGYRFVFAPAALVYFRPRSSLRAFSKQYYRYARGDGKADLWRRRHAVRYFIYLVAVPLLVALSILHMPWWLTVLFAGAALYLYPPYRRLLPEIADLPPAEKLKALAWVPVIRIVGDIAKMVGYPVGWAWRLRRRHDPAVHWRRTLEEVRKEGPPAESLEEN
ncbi:MAG: glycosyltransferase [Anaerolineae bacterium]